MELFRGTMETFSEWTIPLVMLVIIMATLTGLASNGSHACF